MGAEEREQVALFSSSGADGAETREQPSRESSAVSGSEAGRETPSQPSAFTSVAAKEGGRSGFESSHL